MRRGMAKNTDLTKSNNDADDTMTPMHGDDDIDDGGGCDINSDESDKDGEDDTAWPRHDHASFTSVVSFRLSVPEVTPIMSKGIKVTKSRKNQVLMAACRSI